MKRFTLPFVIFIGWATAVLAAAPGTLTSLRQIHSLTNEQAALAPAVEFEATVTYFRGYEKTLFVQDEGIGLYVSATTKLNLVPGDRILVRGLANDSFHPIVASSNITLLHHGTLPPPVPASFVDLVNARLDSQYVTVHGVVRSAEMQRSSGYVVTAIELLTDGGYMGIAMDNSDPAKLDGLLDAEVQISGVASGRFDGKMQETGVLIHTPDFSYVRLLARAPVDAWNTPVFRMDEVLKTLNSQDLTKRVRVQGTITYYYPKSMAILQDGNRSIRVLTPGINPLSVGDRADAIGIPFIENGFLTLKLGQVRSTGAAAPIIPVPVTWDQLASGKHSFDLVSIEGKVVTQVREHSHDVYSISAGDHLFSAALQHPYVYAWGALTPPPPMPAIAPGSRVRVTGVAILDDGNPFNGAVEFKIQLRDASDVVVVQNPPLLNVRNLVLLVLLLLVIVIAGGLRGWVMEHRIRRHTAALAYIEQRRSRILEEINGARPLAAIIEQITELVSFKLKGAPCWCQISDGAQLGNCPPKLSALRVVQQDVPSRAGSPLGILYAAFDPLSRPDKIETDALAMATALAALAIENRRLYSDLLHRSEFDLLTNTHNRFSLDKHLDSLIAEARRNAGIFGLIYLDLDHFKQINDVYGHHIGDLFLKEFAERMKRQLRSFDILGRIGGDEFAALLPYVHSRADVEEIALRLEQCFDEPFAAENITIHGSSSVGIALYPQDAMTKDLLFHAADIAMYTTKYAKRLLKAEVETQPVATSSQL
ncbi:MAG: GGDEF domain-containing protein [Terracidiphilus sp.]|jgi:diguanylate cyclase (GGDEF)-like protein